MAILRSFRILGLVAVAAALLPAACSGGDDRDRDPPAKTDGGTAKADAGQPDAGPVDGTDGGTPADGGTPVKTKETTDELCQGGIDDDQNGFTDCVDFNCLTAIDVTVCGMPAVKAVTPEDLQKPDSPNHLPPTNAGATPPVVSKVKLEHVVVTSPVFKTSGMDSFFVSAPPAAADTPANAWNGVFVIVRSGGEPVQPGDQITVTGVYEEYPRTAANGLSQVGAQRIEKEGASALLPQPAPVTADDLAELASAEPWEGVLVTVENVKVSEVAVATGGSAGADDFAVSAPGSTKKLYVGALMLGDQKQMPELDQEYDRVTGLLHFTYDKFRVQPRSPADLVKKQPPPGDRDADGIADGTDNCPDKPNADQANGDGDDFGDACDNCPLKANPGQENADTDPRGDACDNCANVANADQADLDNDTQGDVCDSDIDGDGTANDTDACPTDPNPQCAAPTERAPAAGELVVNEVLADPAGGGPTDPNNAKGDSNGDGTRDSRADEFIELVNAAGATLLLDGVEVWTRGTGTATDQPKKRFTFPNGTKVAPGKAVVLFGGGTPTPDAAKNNNFCASQTFVAAVAGAACTNSTCIPLTNGGDLVQVKLGAAVLAEFTYGAGQGDGDQSMTRAPDVTGAAFVKHSEADAADQSLFSPGCKLDGSAF